MQSVVRSSLIGLLALAGLAACGDKVSVVQPTSGAGVVRRVTVTPDNVPSLAVGATVTLAASVEADAGVTDRTVTWSSSDATVATVDAATGVVKGVKAGTVTITAAAKADPNVKGAALVTVGGGGGSAVPTVTLSNINQTVCGIAGCNSVPANLTNVAGQVDVTLNVESNGQALRSVQATMTCGTTSVTQTQTISGTNVAPIAAEAAAAPVTLSFNTAAFNTTTGAPALRNGQCTISASATTTSGTQSASTSQSFTLNNQDMAVVTVTSTNQATDPVNRPWIGGGPLTITALPVMYSGRTAVAATIGITGGTPTLNSTPPSTPTQTITSPTGGAFTATWTNGPTPPSVQGYAASGITPTVTISDASGATFTSIGTVTVRGGTTSNTPANFQFNFDDQKPAPGTFSVTNNIEQGIIAPSGQGYIGTGFRFAADSNAGYRGPNAVAGAQTQNNDWGGVDKVTVTFQSRVFGSGAAYTSLTNTANLAESATSQTYELRMITLDALGNADTTGTASSPQTTTIRFGVDRTAPTNTVTAGPATGAVTTVANGTGNISFTVSDNLSGTGPALVAQVRQWNGLTSAASFNGFAAANEGHVSTNVAAPAGATAANWNVIGSVTSGAANTNPCYIGRFNVAQSAAGPNAIPVLSATGTTLGFCTPVVFDLNAVGGNLPSTRGLDGYWYTTVVATDVAGNQAAPVTRVVLEDQTAPTVNNIDLPATITGNSTASFPANVTDNAAASVGDIVGSYIIQNFAGPAVSLRWPTTTGPGVAFDNVLTNSATVTPTIPNFIKNLQVGTTTVVPAAGGNVTSVIVTALGAAGNAGSLTANFSAGLPQLVGGSTSTFTATTIPVSWAIQAPANTNVTNCPGADVCATAATQPTSITLTVTATGPSATFVNPFATGTVQFWYRPTGGTVWYQIGTSSAGSSRDNGTNRFWDFSVTFNPPALTPDGVPLTTPGMTIDIAAIGINANGDAIMSPVQTITVANP